jgi:acyl-CoA synthetase (AMP-forming)/AMP-acid ligase II
MLGRHARLRPSARAFTFLHNGDAEADVLTYSGLDAAARAIAAALSLRGVGGEPALLLYPPGLDFVRALFGCLYCGVAAVPAYPLRRAESDRERVMGLVRDAGAALVLTRESELERLEACRLGVPIVATDALDPALAACWEPPALRGDAIALIQYTSGSTGEPKGVVLSRENLRANAEAIRVQMEQSRGDRIVSWLPPYHDMGLIGNILHPAYAGISTYTMSPGAFSLRPERWLRAIERYRATVSGGPDFAYRLCVERVPAEVRASLDLSSWSLAYSGAETVRESTLDSFAAAFAGSGFRREAFYPCYGLAEATLMVTGGRRGKGFTAILAPGQDAGPRRVSVGRPVAGTELLIVDPQSREVQPEAAVGEIWVRGPGVAARYRGRPAATEATLGGRTLDGRGPYLRTGDLGFVAESCLYVTGRWKDLIIIRGKNHDPVDIERSVIACHPSLARLRVAAFSTDVRGEERLSIALELPRARRGTLHGEPSAIEELQARVRAAVSQAHELQIHDLLLVREGTIPLTSSGKVRRALCARWYLDGAWEERRASPAQRSATPRER